ncbi:uncharacterized protein YbjT (DUF2867 family) [Actinoalloteichus hoggarensis]|uniref:NAD(P)H azoreductase n=1 Tax=Actinoalloteichus hoggarensis TaxID=1470176 RepID=A0A221W7W7_9PSEU|nr:NmrA family NAD(P)-binding protein [Actinoalloteichus hoggarensis]ASO21761.1 NAD(P)H azoreductase [Actinoalloteichus hoggarensis]MBB5922358.1 uncharacterized protein YbjT (DUF2867 family) [Actinoalloteichus hoggarensis]
MSDDRRHLVIGAHGFQGAAVARRLLADGHQVRGLTRTGARPAPGAPRLPVVLADLADAAAVHRAFEGITHVSLVLPLVYQPELVAGYVRTVIDAAREAGIERLVYNANTAIPDAVTPYPAYETRRAAETALRDSGLPLVVLRPPVYLDNLFSPFAGPRLFDRGTLVYPLAADRRVSWLSHADLGAATVAALHRPGLDGLVLPLGGPAVTGDELAAAVGAGLGREVSYQAADPADFEADLRRVIGGPAAEGVAGLYRWAASSDDPDSHVADHTQVERLLGIRLSSIGEWASAQPWEVWSAAVAD